MITWKANKGAPDSAWENRHLLLVQGRSYAVLVIQDGTMQPWRTVANGTAPKPEDARALCEAAYQRVGMTQEQRDQERKDRIDERRKALEAAGGEQPLATGDKPRARRIHKP